MHEMALAVQICETVAGHIQTGQKVTRIFVEYGPVIGIVESSIHQCFPIAAQQAGLEDACLELRKLAADAKCPVCNNKFDALTMWEKCPGCGHSPVTINGGRELVVKQIEVEDV